MHAKLPSGVSPYAQLQRQYEYGSWHLPSTGAGGCGGVGAGSVGVGGVGDGAGPGVQPAQLNGSLAGAGQLSHPHGVVVPWHTFVRGQGCEVGASVARRVER